MPFHLILLVLALVLLVVAAVLDWPRSGPEPQPRYGHALGWLGLASFVGSFLVP